MISKNSKENNSIFSEMVDVMASKEHKEMFEPVLVKSAVDQNVEKAEDEWMSLFNKNNGQSTSKKEDAEIKPFLKSSILTKLEAALVLNPNDEPIKKVVDALKGANKSVSQDELTFALGNLRTITSGDTSKNLTPEEVKELTSKVTKAPTIPTQNPIGPPVPPIGPPAPPVVPTELENAQNQSIPSEHPANAAVLNILIKVANYLGENNFIKSEALADILIESVLDESK